MHKMEEIMVMKMDFVNGKLSQKWGPSTVAKERECKLKALIDGIGLGRPKIWKEH